MLRTTPSTVLFRSGHALCALVLFCARWVESGVCVSLLNGGGVVGVLAVALLDAGMTYNSDTTDAYGEGGRHNLSVAVKASCAVAFNFHNYCVRVRVRVFMLRLVWV